MHVGDEKFIEHFSQKMEGVGPTGSLWHTSKDKIKYEDME
jgi:hypothetical protein